MKNILLILFIAFIISSCDDKNSTSTGKAKPDNTEVHKIGYIQSIQEENKLFFVKVDFFDWFTGEEGGKAMKEDDPKINLDDMDGIPPDNYYIRNEKVEYVKVPIDENAEVIIEEKKANTEDEFSSKKIKLNEFKSLLNGELKSKYSKTPFWFDFKNNKIIKIEEQFLP